MTFIYLIAAGALVWGERRWVDTVFLILMLIIYAVVSETYGYLTSRNRLVPRPVTLRGLLSRAVFIPLLGIGDGLVFLDSVVVVLIKP